MTPERTREVINNSTRAIEWLALDNNRLRDLLKEARQYVADAGCEEEPGEHQAKLLADIDAILI